MSCSVINCPSTPGKGLQVCELHFKDSDKSGELLNKSLKDGAIPDASICPFMCRVCLNENPNELVPLLSSSIELLKYCTSVEVQLTDPLPKQICLICLEKLNVAKEIKTLSIETDAKLKKGMLKMTDIKNEPVFIKIEPEIHIEDTFECELAEDDSNLYYKKEPRKPKKTPKIRKHTNDDPPKSCKICQREFYDFEKLLKHKCIGKKMKCYICGDLEFTSNALNNHLKEFHQRKDSNFECKLCSKKLLFAKTLNNHIRGHFETFEFSCEICGKSFPGRKNLNGHMESHNVNKYSCDLCGVAISIRSNMLKHMKSQHLNVKFPCPDCEGVYATKDSFLFHRTQIHNLEPRFKCEICSKNFGFGSNLRSHQRRFNGNCTVLAKRIATRIRTYRGARNQRTKMAPELKEYISTLKKVDDGWQCNFCPKVISMKQNIEKHRDMHLMIKRFSCDFCPKKFGSQSILDTHRRTHTKEKPYVCLECGTKFGDYSTLIKHRKKHATQLTNLN